LHAKGAPLQPSRAAIGGEKKYAEFDFLLDKNLIQ
jgi:hypothetical protein